MYVFGRSNLSQNGKNKMSIFNKDKNFNADKASIWRPIAGTQKIYK